MFKGHASILLTRLAVALCAVAILGCTDPTPEARLMQTDQALEETTEDLLARTEKIEKLETQLNKQKEKSRQLVERTLTLEERLEKRATDVAIFRAVQTALLNDERLTDSAISVDVEDGVVTIRGLVDSPSKKQAALSIAESLPGVRAIKSRMVAEGSSAKGPGPAG